jgi:hypothetical protein
MPEFWGNPIKFILEQKVEPPQGTGVLGQEHWFVTKFTAEDYPEFVSYHGLAKEEHQETLAATFKRPTTWTDYCALVSADNCTTPDGVAERAPSDEKEANRMFLQDLYTGHFRFTDENNCTLTENCTGHIANYPCGWMSNMESNLYHMNISLNANNGIDGAPNGYTSEQLKEMWDAANATRSHLMMMWWSPEPHYQKYLGKDAEFQRVILKPYTLECDKAREGGKKECSPDLQERVGAPEEACDNPTEPLRKLISGSLYDVIHNPDIPEAIRSPAYDVLRLFQISDVELGELFGLWESEESPRDAICTWAANNLDFLNATVPYSHPRVTREEPHSALGFVAVTLGCMATLLVLLTSLLVYRKREKQAIQYAQTDFLSFLLAGAFLVSLGSILSGLPAHDATCTSAIWFIHVGYTLTLVPLIIKVAAVNKMMEAAREMRRITVKKKQLYNAVAVIIVPVVIYLATWSVVDPPRQEAEYSLTTSETAQGERIVDKTYYCNGGDSDAWRFSAVTWNVILLLMASVLAYQSRNIVQHFNESRTLAFLIYSHFVFVVLRTSTFLLADQVNGSTLDHLRSVLYAVDQMVACVIYFLPKLFMKDNRRATTLTIEGPSGSHANVSSNHARLGTGDLSGSGSFNIAKISSGTSARANLEESALSACQEGSGHVKFESARMEGSDHDKFESATSAHMDGSCHDDKVESALVEGP